MYTLIVPVQESLGVAVFYFFFSFLRISKQIWKVFVEVKIYLFQN